MLFTLLCAAFGAPYHHEPGERRWVKIDLFSFGQALHPYGSDWTPSALQYWSGVLACKVEKPLVEVCQFMDNELVLGILPVNAKQVREFTIPMSAEIEFKWSPTGRLASFDLRGDRGDFHANASNAQLVLYHQQATFKPDSVRRIGNDMERGLVRGLASALEIDLSPKGQPVWKSRKPLWAGRRYGSSSANAAARYAWKTTAAEGGTGLAWDGVVTEAVSTGSQTNVTAKTQVLGDAVLDPKRLVTTQLYTESITASTSVQLVGHTRWIAMSKEWFKGDSKQPAPFPKPRFEVQ